jgi:serine/threonine-protein kinase
MKPLEGLEICPFCSSPAQFSQAAPFLPLRTLLAQGRYQTGRVLEHNGDGATYIGYDGHAQRPVFLREFMPEAIAQRQEGQSALQVMQGCETVWRDCAQNFLELWRKLQRLRGLSALIAVTDVFEENDTIYAVYDYMEWMSLRDFLLRGKMGCLSWERTRSLLMPVLSTLGSLHSQGVLHRGISPSTLMLGSDGKIRISGFSIWQARTAHGDLTADLADGYAALEQYGLNGKQGVWTDIYAFAAVCYRTLIGSDPEDAVSRRHNDRLMVPAQFAERIPAYVINALINAMQVFPEDRTHTMEQFRAELSASPTAAAAARTVPQPPPPPPAAQAAPLPAVPAAAEKTGNKRKKKEKKPASGGVIALRMAAIIVAVGLVVLGVVTALFFREQATEAMEDLLHLKPTTAASTTEAAPEKIMLPVPNLVGKQAESIIGEHADDFNIVTGEKKYDDKIPKGEVISQDPAAGATAEKNSTITLIISDGVAPIELPSIVGKDFIETRKKLEALGFVVIVPPASKENDGSHTAGQVASVIEKAGTGYPKGKEIHITVWGNTDGTPWQEATTPAAGESSTG